MKPVAPRSSTPITPPRVLRWPLRPAGRRGALGLVLSLVVGLFVAVAPAGAQQGTFVLTMGTSGPIHPLWSGVAIHPQGAVVLHGLPPAPAYAAPGAAWGTLWAAGWGPPAHGRRWKNADRHDRLGAACWDVWRDPWFAYWPYCDAGWMVAWGWSPWISYDKPRYARSSHRRRAPIATGWSFAVHFGYGWGLDPFLPWHGWVAYAPRPSIYVRSPILWAVQEPPVRVVPGGGSIAIGSGGWVTAPAYKEDPGTAPPRTATARPAAAEPVRAAAPTRGPAEPPIAAPASSRGESPPVRGAEPSSTEAAPAPRSGRPAGAPVPSVTRAPDRSTSERPPAPQSTPAATRTTGNAGRESTVAAPPPTATRAPSSAGGRSTPAATPSTGSRAAPQPSTTSSRAAPTAGTSRPAPAAQPSSGGRTAAPAATAPSGSRSASVPSGGSASRAAPASVPSSGSGPRAAPAPPAPAGGGRAAPAAAPSTRPAGG